MKTTVNARMALRAFASAFLLSGWMVPAISSAMDAGREGRAQSAWWKPIDGHGELKTPPQAISKLVIKVRNLDPWKSSGRLGPIELPVPGGGPPIVLKWEREDRDAEGLTWYGKVVGDENSVATFAVVGDVLVGDVVTSRGAMYRVDHVSEGEAVVMEMAPNLFAPEEGAPPVRRAHEGNPPETPAEHTEEQRDCGRDAPGQIDAMVIYTEAACAQASYGNCDADTMRGKIRVAIGETQTSFIRSGIPAQISLVHVESLGPYAESGSLESERTRLMLVEDDETWVTGLGPNLDDVPKWRDRYAADTVIMVTQYSTSFADGASCGFAKTSVIADDAYAVVPLDCMTGHFSFTHELGHLMGADHEAEAPTGYNHALIVQHPSGHPTPWRTVMGQGTDICPTVLEVGAERCGRILNWSNPSVLYDGDATGIAEKADNHRALADSADAVANYRASCTRH